MCNYGFVFLFIYNRFSLFCIDFLNTIHDKLFTDHIEDNSNQSIRNHFTITRYTKKNHIVRVKHGPYIEKDRVYKL